MAITAEIAFPLGMDVPKALTQEWAREKDEADARIPSTTAGLADSADRRYVTDVEKALLASGALSSGYIATTLAGLNAYSAAPNGVGGEVTNDGANTGRYMRSGGAWTRIGDTVAQMVAAGASGTSLFPDSFFKTSAVLGRTLVIGGKEFLPTNAVRTWVPNYAHAFGYGAYEVAATGAAAVWRVWFNTLASAQAGVTTGTVLTVGGLAVITNGSGYTTAARFIDASGNYLAVQAGAKSFVGTGAAQTFYSEPVTVPAGAAGVDIIVSSSTAAIYVLDVDAAVGSSFIPTARMKTHNALSARAATEEANTSGSVSHNSQIEDVVRYTALSDVSGYTLSTRVARTEANGFTGFGQTYTTPGSLAANAVYLAEIQRPGMSNNANRWDFVTVEVRTHATDASSASATVVAVGEIAIPREAYVLNKLVVPLVDPVSGKPTSFTQANLLAQYGVFWSVRSLSGTAYCGETYSTVPAGLGTKQTSYYKTTAGWLPLGGNPTIGVGLCGATSASVTRTYPASGAVKLAASPKRNSGALRKLRQKFIAGGSPRYSLALIGDSWSTTDVYYSKTLANYLIAKYGDGGVGFFGLGFLSSITMPVGDARVAYNVSASSGTWTSNYHSGSTSPNISDARGTAGATVTLSNTAASPARPALSAVKLHFTGTADGVIKWRWNGGAYSANTNVQGGVGTQQVLDLTGFPTGTYTAAGSITLEIVVVSGTANLSGIDFQSTSAGFVVHKLGSSGSRASDWLASTAAQWQNGFAALAPDAAIILLGINDASWAVAPDLFGWQMASLVERCRTAIPAVDVMMATPPSTPLAYGSNIPLLASAASDVADRQGCAFVSLQPLFGNPSRPFDYAYSTGRAMFLSDDTHPTPGAAQSIAYELASMLP